jgi:hypothetical protein
MSGARFCRIELRTTDVAAACEFYDAVIDGRGDGIVELPAVARARGAPSHWLGHLGVAELGGVVEISHRLEIRGATRLGAPGPCDPVILRDPGGVVVALTAATVPSSSGVIWHQLSSAEAARAEQNYTELFGWVLGDPVDLGPLGKYRQFALGAGEPAAGSIGDVAGRSGVHPQWLFFFGVPSVDEAVARVRERGGYVIGPTDLPGDKRVAVCDDPEGAAFGLMERVTA